MDKGVAIKSYVRIKDGRIVHDGRVVFEANPAEADSFLKAAYESLGVSYPKFFKMDDLCKTGFIASEYLLKSADIGVYKAEEKGIVFSTANSSLETDIKYFESTKEVASPALFVYTLPNILIGEICIKHNIKGETACFVFDIFDFSFQTEYLNSLLESGKIKAGISGWADFYDGKFDAFFCLVEMTDTNDYIKHDSLNVGKIYNGTWNN